MKLIRHTFPLAALLLALAVHADAADENDVVAPPAGAFAVSYSLRELLGDSADDLEAVIAPDDRIVWELYAPSDYQPKTPPGLMVFISPTSSGAPPKGWGKVMNEQNLVWISANDSGNRVRVTERVTKAILALAVVQRQYTLDTQRIYISGFSGGGKVASMVALDYAGIFKGSIFICGVEPWTEEQPKLIELIKSNHFVFFTGERDFNLAPTKRIFHAYQKAGVEHSKLMVINNMAHDVPRGHTFARAIDYLDEQVGAGARLGTP